MRDPVPCNLAYFVSLITRTVVPRADSSLRIIIFDQLIKIRVHLRFYNIVLTVQLEKLPGGRFLVIDRLWVPPTDDVSIIFHIKLFSFVKMCIFYYR